jgi:hypothetical protein
MARATPDLIDAGLALMERMPAPPNFKVAGMLSIISSLLGRRCWIDTEAELPRAYPNLYVLLVASPGVGKDNIIKYCTQLLVELQEFVGTQRHIVSFSGTSVSPKAIYDILGSSDSEQTFRYESRIHSFRSLTFHVAEMSTIMVDYNQTLIGVLNELYNCSPMASDRIRGQEVMIPNPHVSMLVGNQPATLFEVLPEKAFHMGFTSRLNIFQASQKITRRLFNIEVPAGHETDRKELRAKILADMQDVTLMSGPFRLTHAVGEWFNDFEADRPHEVPGSKWAGYNERRILHIQKFAMICSAAERSDRVLEVRHAERALQIMRDYEKKLPNLFDGVVSSRGYSASYDRFHQIVEQMATPIIVKENGVERLSHYEIRHMTLAMEIAKTHPIHEKEALMKELIQSGLLIVKQIKINDQPAVPVVPRTYVVQVSI